MYGLRLLTVSLLFLCAVGVSPAVTAEESVPGVDGPDTMEDSSTEPEASGTYTVRLRDLEDRVNRLKEQIFRSKARLSLLAEQVLDKKIAGAQAAVVLRNEMGPSFRLTRVVVLLDGSPISPRADQLERLSEKTSLALFDGPVTPGEHVLSVVLHYQGHGYGIFSYLKGYSFRTTSSYTFSAVEGKSIQVEIVGFEKGGPTTPLEERPAVRYMETLSDTHSESSTPLSEN